MTPSPRAKHDAHGTLLLWPRSALEKCEGQTKTPMEAQEGMGLPAWEVRAA
jgi:hypothetical protein